MSDQSNAQKLMLKTARHYSSTRRVAIISIDDDWSALRLKVVE